MFGGNYPQLMAAYGQWMNEKVYAACEKLSDEERKRDRGAFFKSIHGTLDHAVWGDIAWFGRFVPNQPALGPVGEVMFPDFAELKAMRRKLDADILAWAATVTDEYLNEPMTWTSKMYGFTQTHPRWVQIVQMFNHQTHHRGQVTTLLSQLGIDVGPTDLPVLPLLSEG
jgi:uncharacterized damage-inducible protein DinB